MNYRPHGITAVNLIITKIVCVYLCSTLVDLMRNECKGKSEVAPGLQKFQWNKEPLGVGPVSSGPFAIFSLANKALAREPSSRHLDSHSLTLKIFFHYEMRKQHV